MYVDIFITKVSGKDFYLNNMHQQHIIIQGTVLIVDLTENLQEEVVISQQIYIQIIPRTPS